MIDNRSLDDGFFENVQHNKKIKNAFQGAAKWGKIVSIIGLVLVGGWFLFEMAIIVVALFTKGLSSYGAGRALGEILAGVLNIVPFIILLKFSNNIKTGINSDNDETFTKAILHHRNLFRFLGVLWIFYLIVFVIVLALLGTAGLGL